MKKIALFTLIITLIGGGCSFKYDSDWNNQDKADMNGPVATSTEAGQNCVKEGEQPVNPGDCCPGLEYIAIDHAFGACGKPGADYKPVICAAEGETPFVDVPNCCAGLEAKEEGNKYVCRKLY